MNKIDWDNIVKDVLDFNSLVVSKEERSTEAYYLMCCNALDDGVDFSLKAYINRMEYLKAFNSKPDYFKDPIGGGPTQEMVRTWCKIIFMGIKCLDAVSPSQLEWAYVAPYLPEYAKRPVGIVHSFLRPIITVLTEAKYEECDLVGAIQEMLRSEYSKLPLLDDVMDYYGKHRTLYEGVVEAACNAAAYYIETQVGSRFQITWNIVVDNAKKDRVVFKDQFQKVRKPWSYKYPNFNQYCNNKRTK